MKKEIPNLSVIIDRQRDRKKGRKEYRLKERQINMDKIRKRDIEFQEQSLCNDTYCCYFTLNRSGSLDEESLLYKFIDGNVFILIQPTYHSKMLYV